MSIKVKVEKKKRSIIVFSILNVDGDVLESTKVPHVDLLESYLTLSDVTFSKYDVEAVGLMIPGEERIFDAEVIPDEGTKTNMSVLIKRLAFDNLYFEIKEGQNILHCVSKANIDDIRRYMTMYRIEMNEEVVEKIEALKPGESYESPITAEAL